MAAPGQDPPATVCRRFLSSFFFIFESSIGVAGVEWVSRRWLPAIVRPRAPDALSTGINKMGRGGQNFQTRSVLKLNPFNKR